MTDYSTNTNFTPSRFEACALAKLISGQSVNGYFDRLTPEAQELAEAILAEPSPTRRAAAFVATLAGWSNGPAIRVAVEAASPLADLDELAPKPQPDPGSGDMPELPESARLDPALGADVCPWLDSYVRFSRRWSPRAYDDFHTACALWLLSTVAARRVRVNMGKERFPNLYIALTARTSLYAKSSTAEIALQTLQQAGLDWLLAADSATPQKFIADLTTNLVDGYDSLDEDQKTRARLRVGLAGQRGWYYDEFGQHVAAMMRDGGFMAEFRGLLRRMDDTPARYEYGSVGRGRNIVERPYLALLANLTPDDLKPYARKGAGLWGDGFLARFALITPPASERLRDRFPQGERVIPGDLLAPLVAWHKRLGLPEVDISDVTNEKGETTGAKRVEVDHRQPWTLDNTTEVYEAFYAYHDGLLDVLDQSANHDLDGNYARMAEKALRIATLLASMEGAAALTLPYWARAQAITETWRAGLHRLYVQINEPEPSKDEENEEKLLQVLGRLGPSTAAQAARYVRGISSGEASYLLDRLVSAGLLQVSKSQSKTNRYELSKEP